MTEIRLIGSYYEHDNLGIIRITGIKRTVVTFTTKVGMEFSENLKSNMIRPIKLTDEWFAKFQFERIELGIDMLFGYKNPACSLFISSNKQRTEFWINGYDDSDITFVNQLQELYLGWSGELLEAKL